MTKALTLAMALPLGSPESYEQAVARFPMLRLFSLPRFVGEGPRRLELGVRGDPAFADAGLAHLVAGVSAAGYRWERLEDRP